MKKFLDWIIFFSCPTKPLLKEIHSKILIGSFPSPFKSPLSECLLNIFMVLPLFLTTFLQFDFQEIAKFLCSIRQRKLLRFKFQCKFTNSIQSEPADIFRFEGRAREIVSFNYIIQVFSALLLSRVRFINSTESIISLVGCELVAINFIEPRKTYWIRGNGQKLNS